MELPSAADSLQRILVALLVGFLIGLDRERAEVRKQRKIFAGVRTFPLIALCGAVSMLLQPAVGPALVALGFATVGAVALISYQRAARSGRVGATTEIAALGTFLLGATAGAGMLVVAGASGVAVAVLLVAKPRLRAFSRALTEEEMTAAMEMAVISAIVLPLLPNRGFGPWNVLNPFEAWLFVVLVAAVSFAGFVAMRVWGRERGLTVAAVIGALVSSTAVTMAMAERSREAGDAQRPAAGAAVVGCTVMCGRLAILAAMAAPAVLPRLLPVVGAMAVPGLIAGFLLVRRAEVDASAGPRIRNPLRLRAALTFGVIYVAIRVGVRGAGEVWGAAGTFAAAALAGAADVDAITIAIARGGPGRSGWAQPAAAIALAAVVNTLVKLAIALARGAPAFRSAVAISLGAMAISGGAAGIFVYLLV